MKLALEIPDLKLELVSVKGELLQMPNTQGVSDSRHDDGLRKPFGLRVPSFGGYGWFTSIVVVPCVLAATYLFGIATDQYVSEAKFVVRSAVAETTDASSLSVGVHGVSRSHDDANLISEYISSRDALTWLIEHENLRDVFSRPQADFLARFPNFYTADSLEGFYRYYKRMISIDVDDSTGISTIRVSAFTADDAQRIARGLIQASEGLVNRLNKRAEIDAVAVADKEVASAKLRVTQLEGRLEVYRKKVGFVDAQSENVSALKTVTDLSTELARLEATLNQQRKLTPNNPSTGSVESRVSAMRAEIARRKESIAGNSYSIASNAREYSQLIAELGIAQKAWGSAETYKLAARQAAERQHLYLQPVVDANAPDNYTYPYRTTCLIAIFICLELLFILFKYIRQFARDHAV